ncbi:hypothetical protein ACLOJK_039020 [Asimina triloba]
MGISFSLEAVRSKRRERMKQQCHIPEEILQKIVWRLLKKSLCRFKCVSKQWSNLITKIMSNPRWVPPKTAPQAGILVQSQGGSLKFLRLDNEGGASVDDSVHVQHNTNRDYAICDSCNGLLLLGRAISERGKPKESIWSTILFSLGLLCMNFPLFLPIVLYKVVKFSLPSNSYHLCFSVYSFKNKKWRHKELETPVCYTREYRSKAPAAIDLPTTAVGQGYRCMWQFEGRLHCGHANTNRVNIWVLQMEGQQEYIQNQQWFKRQHKHECVIALPNGVIERPQQFLRPFAFHEEFEILYL